MIKVDVMTYDKYGDELEYPVLGRSKTNEMIVLFHAVYRGTVLAPGNSPYHVGLHSDSWDMPNFEFPNNIIITIKNI